MEADDVLVPDVRPELEFQSDHIPEARSIPIDELDARLDELPRDQEIIAYCRGPYCVFAYEAVTLLQKHGYRVRRLPIPNETYLERSQLGVEQFLAMLRFETRSKLEELTNALK